MNIWIFNQFAIPHDAAGGTRHYDFAREFVKQGNQVLIFASGFNHRTRKEERLQEGQIYRRENVNDVEFCWIRTPGYYRGNDWRRMVNMLCYSIRVVWIGIRLRGNPDIILASSPHILTGLAGWILAKLKRAAFIFEVRDLWPLTLIEIGGYNRKNLLVLILGLIERSLYCCANKIVVLMPKASDYISSLGIPVNKVIYIPNGANPELFSDSDIGLPSELSEIIGNLRSRGKFLVGYAGAYGIVNNLDSIIEAAKLLQEKGKENFHFILVGGGTEKSRLINLANILGLNNITFFDPIPKKMVPVFLKKIDVAIKPGRLTRLGSYGVTPNKIFDYMASATPIVWVSNSINNPVEEAKCGVSVYSEDSDGIVNAVIELRNISENERCEMGLRGYNYVMMHHSVPDLATRLLGVMNDAKLE